jgi:hypothetical protein
VDTTKGDKVMTGRLVPNGRAITKAQRFVAGHLIPEATEVLLVKRDDLAREWEVLVIYGGKSTSFQIPEEWLLPKTTRRILG